jgi:hypothetical protein
MTVVSPTDFDLSRIASISFFCAVTLRPGFEGKSVFLTVAIHTALNGSAGEDETAAEDESFFNSMSEDEVELTLTEMKEADEEDSWVPVELSAPYGIENTTAPEAAAAPMMHTEQMIIHMTDGLFILCSISPIHRL